MNRKYLHGRARKDSTRQPFTKKEIAETAAAMLERMTGDKCSVFSRGFCWHIIERQSGDKVGRG